MLPFQRTLENWALFASLCIANLHRCPSATKSMFFHTRLSHLFQTRSIHHSVFCKDSSLRWERGKKILCIALNYLNDISEVFVLRRAIALVPMCAWPFPYCHVNYGLSFQTTSSNPSHRKLLRRFNYRVCIKRFLYK